MSPARGPTQPRMHWGRVLLVLLVLAVIAALLAPRLMRKPSEHVVTVFNDSNAPMLAVELTVAGQTFRHDSLAASASAPWEFRTRDDSRFTLEWRRPHDPDARTWRGGRVSRGPLVQRHELHVRRDDGVIVLVRTGR